MKNLTIILCAFFFLISVQSIFAQDEKPGTLVFSQNMVAMKDLGKVNKIVDSLTSPIWQEIMDEGMLMGWGQLNHEWGDEYNCNFYYVAKDKESFFTAWDEFVKRMSQRHPDAWSEMIPAFQAHKDNIYFFQQWHNAEPSE
jgi:hypothetical protein